MAFQKGSNCHVYRKVTTNTCKNCSDLFETTTPRSRACSDKCRNMLNLKYQTDRRKESIQANLQTITAGCRSRAKKRGYECDIDSNYIWDLYNKQEGLCAVTRVKLLPSSANTRKQTHPHTISIDRIDSNRGYTKDNIHLVTTIYNTAKNNWTHKDVLEMAKELLK